jgi:hypothetical protein
LSENVDPLTVERRVPDDSYFDADVLLYTSIVPLPELICRVLVASLRYMVPDVTVPEDKAICPIACWVGPPKVNANTTLRHPDTHLRKGWTGFQLY